MKPSEKAIECAWNHQGEYSKEKIKVLLVHAYAVDVAPLEQQIAEQKRDYELLKETLKSSLFEMENKITEQAAEIERLESLRLDLGTIITKVDMHIAALEEENAKLREEIQGWKKLVLEMGKQMETYVPREELKRFENIGVREPTLADEMWKHIATERGEDSGD